MYETCQGSENPLNQPMARRDILSFLRATRKEEFFMNDQEKIKDLELQAANTKYLMDKLNKAYLGMTTEEIIRMALTGKEGQE